MLIENHVISRFQGISGFSNAGVRRAPAAQIYALMIGGGRPIPAIYPAKRGENTGGRPGSH